MVGLDLVTNLVSTFGAGCAKATFFGFKTWYYYLPTEVIEGHCEVTFNVLPYETKATAGRSDVLLILLAVVDDLLRLAGLVAIAFIIWGGILYLTSQGSPDQTQKAQQTLQNAIIGLIICVMAIALAGFIGSRVGA